MEPADGTVFLPFHAGSGLNRALKAPESGPKAVSSVEGSLFFFPVLIAVGIAANLRFHLWFTSRFYISELAGQRRKASRWIRWADWLFVLMLAGSAIRIHAMDAIIATLLMAVSIGSMVAFLLIEPTTTKAALESMT